MKVVVHAGRSNSEDSFQVALGRDDGLALLLQYGGFAYIDQHGEVLRVNAISIEEGSLPCLPTNLPLPEL